MSKNHLSSKYLRYIRKLSTAEKNLKIIELINAADYSTARFYLNSELNRIELNFCSEDELLNQILLARILLSSGASIAPLRITNKILNILLKNESRYGDIFLLKMYYQIGSIYIETSCADKIIKLFKNYKKINNQKDFKFELIYNQYKVYSGRCTFTKRLQKKYVHWKSLSIDLIVLSSYIDYLIQYNLFLSKKVSFREILNQIESMDSTAKVIDEIYRIFKAKLFISLGDLGNAKKILNSGDIQIFYLKIEFLFLKKYYLSEKFDLNDDVFLSCYPIFNSYSHIIGNRFLSNKKIIDDSFLEHLPQLKKNQDFSETKLWKIENSSLSSTDRINLNVDFVIDFRSGLVQQKDQFYFLGKSRSLALMAIISTGSYGASDYLISDIVYSNELVSPIHLFSRVQDLVSQLKKLGFPVYRDRKKVFYNFEDNIYDLYLPKNHIYLGPLFHLKTKVEKFSRTHVKNILGISIRSASMYISQWKKKKLITASKTQFGYYRVTPSAFQKMEADCYVERIGSV